MFKVFKFRNKLNQNKNNQPSLFDLLEQQEPIAQEDQESIIEELLDQESISAPPSIKENPNQLKNILSKLPKRSKKFWIGITLLIGLGGTTGVVYWAWQKVENSLPQSVDAVLTYTRSGTITIQAADGTVLQELGPVGHEQLKIWEIPESMINAFIASEDRRFYDHDGVDLQGLTRAAWVNFRANQIVEGGSTITQQLSRVVFLNPEKNIWRKLREMRLAQKVEEKFDKKQILERYLNLVYLGSGAYGVADAAWTYFGKSVDQLTLAETATIAGITPAPSVYSPLENLAKAKERRNLVLKRMEEEGLISPQQEQEAITSELTLNPQEPKRLDRKIPYFTDYIQKELPNYLSKEQLTQGGLIVETTLDLQWQEIADQTVKKAVEEYGKGQRFEQAALVAIDPRNGQIKAMVGGKNFEQNQFNRVTQAVRQPGSTFKTFVYATAIAGGKSPSEGFLDAQYVIDGYKPENYGDTYTGSYLSMREALIRSVNVVAVRALVEVGWNPVINLAHKMGIDSKLKPEYALALGSSEVTLLELTSAYGTLANLGIHQQPHGISRIIDQNGKVIYQAPLTKEEALDRDTASIMTWMLKGVVNNGTGVNASLSDRSVAGKTGTSDKARDLWFIGYIPQVVAGVWLGNDDDSPTYGSSSTAALVWHEFMKQITEALPVEDFPERPNLEGRKATIKLEPIKPKSIYYLRPKNPENENQTNNSNNQPTNRNRSTNNNTPTNQPNRTPTRRNSPNNQNNNNNNSNSNRNSPPPNTNNNSNSTPTNNNPIPPDNPIPTQAPAPEPAPVPETNPAPEPAPVPETNPAPEPAPLPAPPVERKEE